MSLITNNELRDLVNNRVITTENLNYINAASIDVTLGNIFKFEIYTERNNIIDIRNSSISFQTIKRCEGEKICISPGDFILAETKEKFNLPNNIACEYKLKSSMARNGLQHLLAGWGDPGWHGSTMTLEFKNVSQYHSLILEPGMKIGQVVFWKGDPVPEYASYAARGQYNNQSQAQESKGIK